MPCEHCGDQKTAPQHARGLLQQPKQEQDVQGMNEQIADVVVSGVQAKYLAIQGMREPRQRMPVSLFVCGQRPSDRLPIQACSYMWVVENIIFIVVIDEIMSAY